MVQIVGVEGYEAASVDAIVSLAGVSTKALYENFGNKLGCFLATYDLLIDGGMQRLVHAWRDSGQIPQDRPAAMRRVVEELLTLPLRRPEHSRLAIAEVAVVGREALPHIARAEACLQPQVACALGNRRHELPPLLARGIGHGAWHVLRIHVAAGRQAELPGLCEPLLGWMCCYSNASEDALADLASTGATSPAISLPAPPAGVGARARALFATARLAARDGYESLSLIGVADDADLTIGEMLDLFADLDSCFVAAVEFRAARLIAGALRRAMRASDWAQGVCVLIEQTLTGLAEDPTLARLCFVETFAAGAVGSAARSALLARFVELFGKHLPACSKIDPVTLHAAVGAVWGAIHGEVNAGRGHELARHTAEIALLLLAPVRGAEAALQDLECWASGPE